MLHAAIRTGVTAEEWSATRSYKDWSHCWGVKCYTQLQGLEPLLRSEVLHTATRTGANAEEWSATHSYKDWSHCWRVKCYTQLQGLEPLLRSEVLHTATRTGAHEEWRDTLSGTRPRATVECWGVECYTQHHKSHSGRSEVLYSVVSSIISETYCNFATHTKTNNAEKLLLSEVAIMKELSAHRPELVFVVVLRGEKSIPGIRK